MYDIAIIGAGPAGATLARLLGKSYKILLIDKRRLDRSPEEDFRRKCCGGLVAPDAQKVLAELGLSLPRNILSGPQLFVVRTIDLNREIERYYQRFYLNADREKLDRWLTALVPSGVDTRFGAMFKSIESRDDFLLVKLNDSGREYAERVKLAVGADGAASLLRKTQFSMAPAQKKYIAIEEWFKVQKAPPYFSAIFDRDITDFYSWTIPKEDCLLVGSALLPDSGALQRFSLLKDKLAAYGIETGRPVKKEGAFIFRPAGAGQIITGNGRIALTGEAAGFISPSSSEGLSYAMRSARALAESLKEGIHGFEARYSRNAASLKVNIFMKNLKAPFMYNRFLRSAVMKAGLMSVAVDRRIT